MAAFLWHFQIPFFIEKVCISIKISLKSIYSFGYPNPGTWGLLGPDARISIYLVW